MYSGIKLGIGILEYLFQLPLSKGCTLWHSYEEHAFWDTFFNYPYQKGVFSSIKSGTGILGYLFQFPLSRGCTLWHYMGNRHLGYLFQFPLSCGCTLLHYLCNRHLDDIFKFPPPREVLCGILWITGILFNPFQSPSSNATLCHYV